MRRRSIRLLALGAAAAVALAFGPRPGATPLFKAVQSGDFAALQKLSKLHADLFERDSSGRSGLVAAAYYNRIAFVRFFLNHGADVDARDMYGWTALHYAAAATDAKMVALLLAAHAQTQVYSHNCESPLDLAAGASNEEAFRQISQVMVTQKLPVDGTTEECTLTPELKSFTETRLSFHRDHLQINGAEDYAAALASLQTLSDQPRLGAQLLPEILAVVDHPSPDDAVEYSASDAYIRRFAAHTLSVVAVTPAQKKQVAAYLTRLVGGGGCAGYGVNQCQGPTQAACGSTQGANDLTVLVSLLTGQPLRSAPSAWPRSPQAETCFNCAHCSTTRIGNGFKAALTWFEENPAFRDHAEAALAHLVTTHVLAKSQYQELKAQYLPAAH